MLCFQGNQKGAFPGGLKQGERAVAVVANTPDEGWYCCSASSAPKRHKERKKIKVSLLKPFTCETTSQQVEVPQEKQPGTTFQPILISLCTTPTPSLLPRKQHLPSQASRRLPRGQNVVPGALVHNLRFFPIRGTYLGSLIQYLEN